MMTSLPASGQQQNARNETAQALQPTQEYLAFTLGQEEYGIDIQSVQELRGYETVTRIAHAPSFIKGVVNLRGVIVPVVDMRIKFQVGTQAYDSFTVVVILNLGGRTVGIVVDSVSDVIALKADDIKPPPEVGNIVASHYLRGLSTIRDRLLILIDIKKLMDSPEMGLTDKMAA